MSKKRTPGVATIALAVASLLVLAGLLAGPTFAQQNGTVCPEYIYNDPNEPPLYLFLDSTCDAQGMPRDADYNGGSHSACYSDYGNTPGLTHSCDVCPSNWENCTPCPNFETECGENTPDPPPSGSGNFIQRIVLAVDWLTA